MNEPEHEFSACEGMAEMWATGAKTRQTMCLLIHHSDLPAADALCG